MARHTSDDFDTLRNVYRDFENYISTYNLFRVFRGKPCEKLAVIYFKLANEAPSPSSFGLRKPSAATLATHDLKDINERRRYLAPNKPRERQLSESQKLSESLALEKGMLSKLHFVGIVPVP